MKTEISGIPIEIIRKNIKNLHLYVLLPDGRVRVTAPKKMTDSSIKMFIGDKIGWIQKKQEKILSRAQPAELKYVTDEEIFIFGKRYYLDLRYAGRSKKPLISEEKVILTLGKDSGIKKREKYLNKWFRELLKTEILKYLPKWENITGLHPSDWQIKNMRTRWGTCNTMTGKIWINLQLVKKPVVFLEYVLLHELVHLRVRNHGKDFKAALDRYMPEWREIKKQLNGNI